MTGLGGDYGDETAGKSSNGSQNTQVVGGGGTASPAPFASFDVDQVLGLLNKSLVALRTNDATRFFASVGAAVQQLRDSLDLRRLNDPSVNPAAIRAMLLRSLQPFMTAADLNRLNAWDRLFRSARPTCAQDSHAILRCASSSIYSPLVLQGF